MSTGLSKTFLNNPVVREYHQVTDEKYSLPGMCSSLCCFIYFKAISFMCIQKLLNYRVFLALINLKINQHFKFLYKFTAVCSVHLHCCLCDAQGLAGCHVYSVMQWVAWQMTYRKICRWLEKWSSAWTAGPRKHFQLRFLLYLYPSTILLVISQFMSCLICIK